MLPKYFTLILSFYSILPESRNLLGFCSMASTVYNIMLSSLVITLVYHDLYLMYFKCKIDCFFSTFQDRFALKTGYHFDKM